jgi:multiple sugar transport system ATP-binding protein
MNEGRIQQIAPPLEVYNNPVNRFVASFIGSPAMNFLELSIKGNALVDEATAISITLPERFKKALQNYNHSKVVLGIRPEGLRPAASGQAIKAGGAHFVVDVIQHLGHEVLLDASTGGQRIVARVGPKDDSTIGERRAFIFDMLQAHLFDVETGVNLTQDRKFTR